MKKLNLRKIRWIIREVKKGELSVYQIAKQQGVTPRWARELPRKYGGIPLCKIRILKCGRKPKSITQEEVDAVKKVHEEHWFGAVNTEKILNEQGIHIPHNRIHKILKEQGLAKEQPAKKKRRKWIRYERRHSNSLWHTDWFEHKRKQYILYEDDASRLVTGAGKFSRATTENSISVYDSAVDMWSLPKQVISDHGTQFCADEEKNYRFKEHLREKGSKHIMGRVKHPQSNGKLERLVHTMKGLLARFGDLDKAVEYYNFRRPHMSLENGRLRTPYRAFVDKMRKTKNS